MHALADVRRVQQLAAQGWSRNAIARATGISRTTVGSWLDGRYLGRTDRVGRRRGACHICDATDPPARAYAYLLGQYLGDGWITTARNGVQRLTITSDERYPGIIDETAQAMRCVVPGSIVGMQRVRGARCVNVMTHSKHIACLFPQHGPGRKHERRIALVAWQTEIVARDPAALVRGLIHSDGCRCLNRVRKTVGGETRLYAYPRYLFSNNSADIQHIFTDALDRLGMRWTQNRWNSISVASRPSVARMDELVGPKT